MLRIIFIVVCLLFTSFIGFSQTKRVPTKKTSVNKVVSTKETPIKTVTELSQSEWSEMSQLLEAEDWEKLSAVSALNLKKLVEENDKKQLAQLNYIYLFSLAGKVAQGKMTVNELKNITQTMIGKDFIMFNRNILDDCTNSLNYVCPDKTDKSSIRVSATNKEFNLIHSFEYVKLLQEFDFAKNKQKSVYVSGKLAKVEVNEKPDKAWIMRLFFNDGWVQVIDK